MQQKVCEWSNIVNLEGDKLINVTADLSKLSNLVYHDVVKKLCKII